MKTIIATLCLWAVALAQDSSKTEKGVDLNVGEPVSLPTVIRNNRFDSDPEKGFDFNINRINQGFRGVPNNRVFTSGNNRIVGGKREFIRDAPIHERFYSRFPSRHTNKRFHLNIRGDHEFRGIPNQDGTYSYRTPNGGAVVVGFYDGQGRRAPFFQYVSEGYFRGLDPAVRNSAFRDFFREDIDTPRDESAVRIRNPAFRPFFQKDSDPQKDESVVRIRNPAFSRSLIPWDEEKEE